MILVFQETLRTFLPLKAKLPFTTIADFQYFHFLPNIFFLSLLTVNLAVGVPITYKLLTFDY